MSTAASSIDPADVARFSAIAEEWWDPNGKFAPLHRFNPVRLDFIREQALARFGREAKARTPFEGLSLLDIGCGGGLLCEPMRRLGFAVHEDHFADVLRLERLAARQDLEQQNAHGVEIGARIDGAAAARLLG